MILKPEFIEMLQRLIPDEAAALCRAITDTAPEVGVRVNPTKGALVPPNAAGVPWCDLGFYCDTRPAFTFDPMLHGGLYYVQDTSSMFIHHVIRRLLPHPVRYLDLCAAPGGKTTAALQALPQGSLVVANDIVPNRARALADNVMRWGNPHAVVTCNAPQQLGQLSHLFDVVAADVPCSGEGMMRKDSEAVQQWSPALVQQCAARQRDIVRDIWPALRPGGLLIYSTCTYNRIENEEMVEWIIQEFGAEPVNVAVNGEWGIAPAVGTDLPCYRFMPHRTRGEGLFMAVLRKPDGQLHPASCRKPDVRTKAPTHLAEWLVDGGDYDLSMQGSDVVANPRAHRDMVATLRARGNVVYSGVTLCTVKGRNHVPHQALAMSTAINRDAWSVAQVDDATALAYLRGEVIKVDAPRGHALVAWHDVPLGWVNNLGGRANNLYPKGLRIISKGQSCCSPVVAT